MQSGIGFSDWEIKALSTPSLRQSLIPTFALTTTGEPQAMASNPGRLKESSRDRREINFRSRITREGFRGFAGKSDLMTDVQPTDALVTIGGCVTPHKIQTQGKAPAPIEGIEEQGQHFVAQIVAEKKEDRVSGRISQLLASSGSQARRLQGEM